MSKKPQKESIFSGDAAFEERAVTSTPAIEQIQDSSFPEGVKVSGEPEQPSLIQRQRNTKFNPEKLHQRLREKFAKDQMWVKGTFANHECPQGHLEFFASAYGDIEQHVMYDGLTYTVRKWVADHLNKNCREIRYSDEPVLLGQVGRGGAHKSMKYEPMKEGGKPRFSFMVEDFIPS